MAPSIFAGLPNHLIFRIIRESTDLRWRQIFSEQVVSHFNRSHTVDYSPEVALSTSLMYPPEGWTRPKLKPECEKNRAMFMDAVKEARAREARQRELGGRTPDLLRKFVADEIGWFRDLVMFYPKCSGRWRHRWEWGCARNVVIGWMCADYGELFAAEEDVIGTPDSVVHQYYYVFEKEPEFDPSDDGRATVMGEFIAEAEKDLGKITGLEWWDSLTAW